MRQVKSLAALIGATAGLLIAAAPASAQVSSINSAVIVPRAFNDMSNGTGTYLNAYPASVTLGETGVGRAAPGGLDRDIWYFSNNGTSAYNFQNGDYFDSTFTVDVTGIDPTTDLEGGYIFSNPSGSFGGDCQLVVIPSSNPPGDVVQFGGPSFYDFVSHGTPSYVQGTTITLGFNFVLDPATNMPAFQYSVNGVFATSLSTGTYFDLSSNTPMSGNCNLGGYFQIGNSATGSNSGQAVFTSISITPVPEPASLGLLGLGGLAALRRRR